MNILLGKNFDNINIKCTFVPQNCSEWLFELRCKMKIRTKIELIKNLPFTH